MEDNEDINNIDAREELSIAERDVYNYVQLALTGKTITTLTWDEV